jgi:predicted RND superfamily exporter protein
MGKAGAMQNFSRSVGLGLERGFYKIGAVVGSKPKTVIAGSIFFIVLFGMGLSKMHNENRGDKLWIPKGTEAAKDQVHFDNTFDSSSAPRFSIYMLKTMDGGNILTKSSLLEAMEIYDDLVAMESAAKDSKWSFSGSVNGTEAVCQMRGRGCWVDSVFAPWNFDIEKLRSEASDASVLATFNTHYAGYSDDELSNYLGSGLTRDGSNQVATAKVIRTGMWLKNRKEFIVATGREEDPIADEWEQGFLDTVKDHDFADPNLGTAMFSTRSFSDEIGGSIRGDIKLVSIGYLIIIIYLMVNLGDCNCLDGKIAVSACGILTVGFSIVFSFGFSSLCGYPYTPVHSVLPFVLLGIGVDDCFVSFNSFSQTSVTAPMRDRAATGLSHAGVSILVTSVTDFLAFIIGSTTSLPALASFCFFAAFGVLGLLLLQLTFFYAVIVLDARRVAAHRRDCCCCCTSTRGAVVQSGDDSLPADAPSKTVVAKRSGGVRRFLADKYTPWILTDSIRPLVLVFFLVLTILGACGASQLKVESHEGDFVPDGSYLKDTLADMDEHFLSGGARLYVVTLECDYFAQRTVLTSITGTLTGKQTMTPWIKNPAPDTYSSWVDDFESYLTRSGLAPSSSDTYMTSLQTFLTTNGTRHVQNVVWVDATDPTAGIMASRIQTEHVSFKSFRDGAVKEDVDREVEAMTDMRTLVSTEISSKGVPSYAYSSTYLDWETYRVIHRELYQNIGLALLAVLAVTVLLIAHVLTAGLVFACVLLTIVDILGLMYVWGLYIDTVAVINLVLAVGLSVDYSAHVAHCFMTKTGSRKERVTQAMEDIGVPVLNGAISTFLAVVVLGASQSYVFRVLFRQFFATCLFGVMHGMCLLPVVLSYIGPPAYAADEDGAGSSTHVSPSAVVPAPAPAPSDLSQSEAIEISRPSPAEQDSGVSPDQVELANNQRAIA